MDTNVAHVDIDLLKNLQPLSLLADEQLEELAHHARIQRLEPGADLFHDGDTARQTVYLLSGAVELGDAAHGSKRVINGGTPESLHPLAREIPRNGTAVAVTLVDIVRIDSDLMETMLAWGQIACPETEVIMSQDGVMTIDKGNWLKKMLMSPTFNKLPPANIEQLLERLEPIKVNAGDVIIKQGDSGDYFYMLNEGIALVSRQLDQEGDAMELAELKEGASFGESALISNKPRNATITMMTDGVLLRLSKDNFIKLLQEPTLRWVDYEQARRQIADGGRWLDVRMHSEFLHAHLHDADNVPMQDLHKKSQELDHAPIYVCYCDSGKRSSAAAFVLSKYGFKACVLKDGMQAVPATELITA